VDRDGSVHYIHPGNNFDSQPPRHSGARPTASMYTHSYASVLDVLTIQQPPPVGPDGAHSPNTEQSNFELNPRPQKPHFRM